MKEKNISNIEKEKKKNKKIIIIAAVLILLELIYLVHLIRIYNDDSLYEVYLAKPIIYLYPEEETEVTVKLGYPSKLTTSYPKYNENTGWKLIARPDGTLTDTKTGRSLYSLYWEGIQKSNISMKEGFLVKGEDTASFLEEKLEILGLTEREAEEFIVYWLPRLEENKYNFIRFETIDKINEDMPLEITPKPDTLIRIWMEYKGLDKEIKVKEQILETPERKGFVAVEWGGIENK